ncbi:MAG: serine hydrolase domain-containing protein, partial [Bacteroidota bacterium]
MKAKFFFLSIAILTLTICGMNNQLNKDVGLREPNFIEQKFDSVFTALYKEYQIRGDVILGLVNKDGLVHSLALDDNIFKGKKPTLNNDSPIYLASHTKSFTGTLLRKLEEEGKIDLSRSLHDYLPQLTLDGSVDTKSISIRQVLNHSHGLYSMPFVAKTAFMGYSGGNNTLISNFNETFSYDSTHRFRYANTGPVLAAIVAEEKLGIDWREETKNKIFKPLGMNSSSSRVSDFNKKDIRPFFAININGELLKTGFYKNDIVMSAAGGTLSTVNDLSKWLSANLRQDERIFKTNAAWKDLHQPTVKQDRTYFTYKRFGYSLGWDVAQYENDTILTRFGSYAGSIFHASIIPTKDLGFIGYSSDERAAMITHLAANYAYNMITQPEKADHILEEEKATFDRVFKIVEERLETVSASDRIEANKEYKHLIGEYDLNDIWPNIKIKKEGKFLKLYFGELEGYIYARDE